MIDLPPCPTKASPRHSWIMRAANIYAHRAIREAVDLITSKLPAPLVPTMRSIRPCARRSRRQRNTRTNGRYTPAADT